MSLRSLVPIFISVALTSPALAVEPRKVASVKQVKPGTGAVRLAVRTQTQQAGTLHVWFLRDGGDPARSADVFKFERKQGVPLAGVNMVDLKPGMYALPAGRYRLLAHGVKCPGMPPEGTIACSVTQYGSSFQTPAARYGADAPVFEVVAGRFTDAGDYILEVPPGVDVGEDTPAEVLRNVIVDMQIKVRPIAAPPPPAFAALPRAAQPPVPARFASQIRCEARPKGAMMYLPFAC